MEYYTNDLVAVLIYHKVLSKQLLIDLLDVVKKESEEVYQEGIQAGKCMVEPTLKMR